MSYLRLFRFALAVAFSVACLPQARAASLISPATSPRSDAFGQIPLRFEANAGQTDPEARFLARGRGFTLFLTGAEAVLALRESAGGETAPAKGRGNGRPKRFEPGPKKSIQTNLRMTFVGANRHAEIAGADEQSGPVSYFTGNEPGRWRTGIPSFSRVKYDEIYPATDLVFYGREGELEYDFIVRPGGDPSRIELEFAGARSLALTDGGDLVVLLDGGHLRWHAPVAYQDIDGERRAVDCAFTLPAEGRVAFSVGSYDAAQPLTIDPLLVYSTYLGGSLQDIGQAIAVDRMGTVFVTGQADSLNFPTNRAFRGTNSGGADVFVARLNTNATAFHYSTYVGGNNADIAFGIAVDSGGNAYVAGRTESANFPTRNAFQNSLDGTLYPDAFIFKLGTNGTNLIYSSYFGGSDLEAAYGVAVDAGTNNAYLVGETFSGASFPKKSPFQNNAGGLTDAFVARFNTSSSGNGSLGWASWLGGGDDDVGFAIKVDTSGNVYVTGQSTTNFISNPTFPLQSPFQSSFRGGITEAFVAKIDATGGSIVWSSYLGGNNNDAGFGIALDSSNNVYVAGSTSSDDFPLTNALQTAHGDGGFTYDAFLARIRANGSGLTYSTFLGGQIDDEARAVAVDAAGNAWIAGGTFSANFPNRPAPLQTNFGGAGDAFVAMINPALSGPDSLLFSTYYGARAPEYANGIAVDTNGNCYIIGEARGTNAPGATAGVVQPNYGGGASDAFVAKFFAPPQLRLTRTGTNHLASWSVFPAGFAAEARANVNSGSWANLPGVATTNSGMRHLVVTNTGPRRFIRLRKP